MERGFSLIEALIYLFTSLLLFTEIADLFLKINLINWGMQYTLTSQDMELTEKIIKKDLREAICIKGNRNLANIKKNSTTILYYTDKDYLIKTEGLKRLKLIKVNYFEVKKIGTLVVFHINYPSYSLRLYKLFANVRSIDKRSTDSYIYVSKKRYKCS